MNKVAEVRIKEVLAKAKELVEKGWTQRYFAVDADGDEVCWDSKFACKFCAMGALYRASGRLGYGTDVAIAARGIVINLIPGTILGAWNDLPGRTQEQVVNLLDVAIGRLE
jgi:hypothetical protein